MLCLQVYLFPNKKVSRQKQKQKQQQQKKTQNKTKQNKTKTKRKRKKERKEKQVNGVLLENSWTAVAQLVECYAITFLDP